MAVDTDGTLYVLVQATGSSGTTMELLAYPPGANGNTPPERTATLEGPIIPGYAVGLALDGHGNFWISAIQKLLRYPTTAQGNIEPNASIRVHLATPDGMMAANSSNVAVDAKGDVYSTCTVVYMGAQAIGVSEYRVGRAKRAKLVRSFYDLNLPEVPPSSIAIDPNGIIYLASSLPASGVFAYEPGTKSGNVNYSRRFVGPISKQISSIATDSSGNVYVAAASEIMVFGPKARGHVRPKRRIVDPDDLHYSSGDYGTLLDVR